ncbi:nuclear transport factor 2 family protein [Kumtagia ephedrae]|uniref:SnoaL-like domain-containing protein n=1 Tax=Kumtagia ephedrae TaxID=2116701 RepID=A0A2P7S7K3_9HYPH|nr:nuclear transport factor 2 family protein [Mesorhizobium ephedrae]PSJ58411.1 hypothetical protein C7I84_15735 [Mesorhizobium ephedrae]
MTALDTVKAIYELYGAGDMDGALKYCDEDVCFDWPVDQTLVRFGGHCKGRDAFRARLAELHRTYDYHAFRPAAFLADGDRVAAQIEVELTHRGSGRRFQMRSAHFWTVLDGRATELLEYYDTALIAAVEQGSLPSAA